MTARWFLFVTLNLILLLVVGGGVSLSAEGENVELVGHIGGVTHAVAVQGNHAYIGNGPSFTVLDISNPTSPIVLGRTDPLPSIIRGVAISGSFAYVAAGSDFVIIDVTDPTSPTEVGSYHTGNTTLVQNKFYRN